MNDLERFYACFDYGPVDRHPFWFFGIWPETHERWLREGWNPETYDPAEGAEKTPLYSGWFQPAPPFEKQIIEENEGHITYINHEGILMREMKNNPSSSMPQFIRFPVETREDFRKFWAERMQPDLASHIGPDWKNQIRAIRDKEPPVHRVG